jgi:hypothetical protein
MLALAGCSGGGEAETPEDTGAAAQPPAAAPAAPAQPAYVTDRSINDNDIEPVEFPSFVATTTPTVFTDKLEAGRPMLIFFYDPAQGVTDTQRPEIDAVMEDYRGLIDLITFDIGGGSDDAEAQSAVVYASELGVSGTPYTIVVDGNGFITWRWKGYVDREYIAREVERATR